MKTAFDSIKKGLEEAIAYSEGKIEARTRKVVIEPVPTWKAETIRSLRTELKLSQSVFGVVLGVSPKTVEAWESGKNTPNGSASRLMEVISREKEILVRQKIMFSN